MAETIDEDTNGSISKLSKPLSGCITAVGALTHDLYVKKVLPFMMYWRIMEERPMDAITIELARQERTTKTNETIELGQKAISNGRGVLVRRKEDCVSSRSCYGS